MAKTENNALTAHGTPLAEVVSEFTRLLDDLQAQIEQDASPVDSARTETREIASAFLRMQRGIIGAYRVFAEEYSRCGPYTAPEVFEQWREGEETYGKVVRANAHALAVALEHPATEPSSEEE